MKQFCRFYSSVCVCNRYINNHWYVYYMLSEYRVMRCEIDVGVRGVMRSMAELRGVYGATADWRWRRMHAIHGFLGRKRAVNAPINYNCHKNLIRIKIFQMRRLNRRGYSFSGITSLLGTWVLVWFRLCGWFHWSFHPILSCQKFTSNALCRQNLR